MSASLRFTRREAVALLRFFGGAETNVTVTLLDEHQVDGETAPAGLYAHCTEYPEDGSLYLGPGDDAGLRDESAPAIEDLLVSELWPTWRAALTERQRQIDVEGWTSAHDDEHPAGELASAGAAYALAAAAVLASGDPSPERIQSIAEVWPWGPDWLKPAPPQRCLEKAAALILAEADREYRAAKGIGGAR